MAFLVSSSAEPTNLNQPPLIPERSGVVRSDLQFRMADGGEILMDGAELEAGTGTVTCEVVAVVCTIG